VSLLSAAFAPDSPKCQMVIYNDLEFLRLICLIEDRFNHRHTFFQVFILVSSDQHVERYVIISLTSDLLIRIVNTQLFVVLSALAPYLDLAVAFSFEFLLRCATGPNNLPYVVDGGVVGIGDEDFTLFFGWFVIWWGLVACVEGYDFVYEVEALFEVAIFEPLVSRIRSQSSLRVVDGLRTR
jgi:hypothetical protein